MDAKWGILVAVCLVSVSPRVDSDELCELDWNGDGVVAFNDLYRADWGLDAYYTQYRV